VAPAEAVVEAEARATAFKVACEKSKTILAADERGWTPIGKALLPPSKNVLI
jgi:hypothetical protein